MTRRANSNLDHVGAFDILETGASSCGDSPPLDVRPDGPAQTQRGEIAMRIHKLALMACGAAVLGLTVASPGGASALAANTNHLTFSGAVALPGVTLPRGTYTFEVVELHPDIVRVLSRDGSRVYFTGFTTTVNRPMDKRADRLITLVETSRGVPPRIETWYPIGQSTGRRFIYPDVVR
jgi:hypothetical protein